MHSPHFARVYRKNLFIFGECVLYRKKNPFLCHQKRETKGFIVQIIVFLFYGY